MKTENVTNSLDKLQDALGLIDEEFIIEAMPESSADVSSRLTTEETAEEKQSDGMPPGLKPTAEETAEEKQSDGMPPDLKLTAVEAVEEKQQSVDNRNETIKWKKRSRIAGVIVVAACLILLVAAVIFLPKNQDIAQSSADHMTTIAKEEETGYQFEGAAADSAENAYAEAEENAAAEEYAEEFAPAEEAPAYAAADEAAAPEAMFEETPVSSIEDVLLMEGDETGFAVTCYQSADADKYLEPASLVISNRGRLDEFFDQHKIIMETSYGRTGIDEAMMKDYYDETFFKDNNLVIGIVELTSGSYDLHYLYTEENGKKAVQHYDVYRADRDPALDDMIITTDMASWLIFSEVPKEITEASTLEEEYPY